MGTRETYLDHNCREIQQRLDERGAALIVEAHESRGSEFRLMDENGAVVGPLPFYHDAFLNLIPRQCNPETAAAMLRSFELGYNEGYESAAHSFGGF